jgi:hypothetical protein
MNLAERMRERFRARLKRQVDHERAALGCMALAMKKVGSRIGLSVMAIKRVIGRYGGVKVQDHHHVALILYAMKPKRSLPPLTICTRASTKEAVFIDR